MIKTFDQPPVEDDRPRRGEYPLAEAMCWNHMTPDQRRRLASSGVILAGQYGGGPCNHRAEVAVPLGLNPGPRYYCLVCAAALPALIEELIP